MCFVKKTKVTEFANNQGMLTLGLLQALYALIAIIILIRLLLSTVGEKFFRMKNT